MKFAGMVESCNQLLFERSIGLYCFLVLHCGLMILIVFSVPRDSDPYVVINCTFSFLSLNMQIVVYFLLIERKYKQPVLLIE